MEHSHLLLDNLNPQQRTAVQYDQGPLLIIAGPGSGKTRALTHRIAWLISEKGVPPGRILAVTFTNKAAGEMSGRLKEMLPPDRRHPAVGTFHSFCARLLRRPEARSFVDPGYTILDADDQLQMMKEAANLAGLKLRRHHARNLTGLISQAKNRGVTPETYPKAVVEDHGEFPIRQQAAVYERYERLIHGQNCLDFDDLLIYAVNLLETNSRARAVTQDRFDHILIDEFQDTNRLQGRLVELLAGDNPNVCAVGDPDQQIYSWRNADRANIGRFKERFNPAVIPLGRNYRSTPQIVGPSARLIACNSGRDEITLFTENGPGAEVVVQNCLNPREEAEWIAGRIEESIGRGRPPQDHAVLYRTNRQSRALEHSLSQRKIGYHINGGIPFWSRREIKDVMAYLSIVQNPAGILPWRRVITTPPKGVGSRTIEKLADHADRSGSNLGQALAAVTGRRPADREMAAVMNIKGKPLAGLNRLNQDHRKIAQLCETSPPHEIIRQVIEITGLAEHIKSYENPEERWGNVEELLSLAAQYADRPPQEALTEFLAQASLNGNKDQNDEATTVTLSNLHQAKGMEWPAVFIAGLNEGILPSARAHRPEEIEEERRLCYVGITRAKEELCLTCVESRTIYDGTEIPCLPSRFIKEAIPPPPNPKQKARAARSRRRPHRRDPQETRYAP